MNITPTLPDGYNGPLKQLTCRTCHQVFYLTWADYKRLGESLSCHECSVIENETAQTWRSQTSASSDSPFSALWTVAQVATALHLGRTKVYELIWKEGLPVIHFGRSVRISPQALRTWLKQREQEH
ncbi:MAG TPA: helix-turn-helix domain-containing protein [Ktedonobacteraceae bacterium]|nr:helix-turn-helix domain-containing protein [Ktedonobacteraceae bacterium]